MARRTGSGPVTKRAPSRASRPFRRCSPRGRAPTGGPGDAGKQEERAMVVTTRVRLDRIASATRNAGLSPEVIVGDEIVSAEGYVLAVRILEDKSTYNTVEDVTGRMLALRGGDVLAGVLGTRDRKSTRLNSS